MNVCMLVLNSFTNDTRVYKEAHTLAKHGIAVTVWALGDGTLPSFELTGGFTVRRWTPPSIQRQWHLPGLPLAEMILGLTTCLRQQVATVYHAHDPSALLPCFLAARSKSALLVYDAHELWSQYTSHQWRGRARHSLWKFTEARLIRQTQATITVNSYLARELNRKHGVEPTILMNCQNYENVPKSDILRKELAIPQKDRIVIYPGIWAQGRGLEHLIQSIPYLDRVTVVLMGHDRIDGKLQRLARELQVQEHIRFREPVPPHEVASYVASADLGVMPTQATNPSYYFGSGNKLYHYIAAGIPAAVSNHPEKRRIVEEYGVGIVFDETDPRSIAEAINTVLNDKVRYLQMCQNAKRAAREHLNWANEEKKLVALYESLQGSS